MTREQPIEMEIGIVGLPNAGKSTLFNALTAAGASVGAYPFTTIEPNVAAVAVPDPRLQVLTGLFKPKKTTPATIRFVDIAGLVRGASQGEGLGNKFLSHIREVDAILHVSRLFKSSDVAHTLGSVDPARDAEVIETELMLADLASLDRQKEKLEGKAKSGDKEAKEALESLLRVRKDLEEGRPARLSGIDPKDLAGFFLLSAKPMLYVGNVGEAAEDGAAAAFSAVAKKWGAESLVLSAKLEAEIAALSPEERPVFLKEMGLKSTGLERVILAAYHLLGLASFFTAGEDEVRAWTIHRGDRAPQAAGVIHTDFEKGFIRAEVYSYSDIAAHSTEAALRSRGLIRTEGKDYVVQDGDVCFFKFSN